MKSGYRRRRGLVFALLILVAALCAATASAQGTVRLASLNVSLWPEYDKEGVLVIYHGEVADDVTLPVTLRFLMPKEAGVPAATAGVDASGEYRYLQYELEDAGDFLAVSYTNPYRVFQFEYYYNPLVITDTLRTFTYTFQADYATESLAVEVKQPAGAQDLTLTPVATETGIDFDGLPLQGYMLDAFEAGQTFELSAQYEKTDPRLSSEILALPTPGTAEFEDMPKAKDNTLAYILIGVAGALLVGAGVYAVTQGRKRPKTAPVRSARPKPKTAKQTRAKTEAVAYCHKCGTGLRPGDAFCPKCGTKVKKR